jgi:mono/diheme cytochrome c family protein
MQRQHPQPALQRLFQISSALLIALALVGCTNDMYNQAKYEPMETSQVFPDRQAMRPLPPGVVMFGDTREDTHYYTGQVDGAFVTTFPFPVDRETLYRGQERYEIYCSPCHGLSGYGNGMIEQRTEQMIVPSLHQQRLRDAPEGLYFEVITNGYRYMYGYGTRISVEDRWAIIAYIRALQRSQQATLKDVPTEERHRLEGVQ